MTTALPQPGELFETRYRVEAEIGQGGFSRVYRALDESQSRTVALKILVPAQIDNGGGPPVYQSDIAERFLREARVLENVREGHAIQLLNHGRSATGVLFMVFEYVDGKSLFDIIKDYGALPPDQVADILQQTLQTLQAAHSQGILHRDIKPNNVMITTSGQVKVLDFGIAKAFGDASPGNDLTAAGMLVGTPRYMAPEQLRGQPIGPAADVYALGILGVEMLSGRKAMRGKDRMDIIQQQLMPQSVQLPPEIDVPPRLREIVDRMVQKDTHLRYASAAAVLRDLQFWDEDEPIGDDTVLGSINLSDLGAHHVAVPAQPAAQWSPQANPQTTAPPQNLALGTQFGKQPASNASMSQIMQQYGSAQFQPPVQTSPTPHQQWGTGQFPAQQPMGSGTYPAQSWAEANYGNIPPTAPPISTFEPTREQKILLGVSLLIPGLAHVMIGQVKKGIGFFVLLFLSFGLLYVVSVLVAFDAFLVLRAQKNREVKEFEFFPDSKSFFA